MLIAGLFRALVAREAAHMGTQATMLSPTVGRGPRYGGPLRSGLEGDLGRRDGAGRAARRRRWLAPALIRSAAPDSNRTGEFGHRQLR